MRNFFLFFFSTLFYINADAQISVRAIVKDSLQNPIEFANIVVIDKDQKTLGFGNTDVQGIFTFSAPKKGNYTVKASFLGYASENKTLEVTQDVNVNFILKSDIRKLEEVVIEARNSGMVTKGDTLQYNIDRFLNGTEETLEDVIKRLPGMGIDKEGKITSEGKVIDQLLIDGDEFFKNQHSLATANISSEMIENIQRIKNYKKFGSITNKDESDLVAVNVNIKEKFKNRLTGNFNAQAGYEEKFKLGGTLMNFSKKVKMGVIGSTNNTGEQGITLNDYYDLIRKEDDGTSETSNVIYKTADDVPSFLAVGNNAKSRKTDFTALTLAFSPSKKMKLNVYSIFNQANQQQEQFIRQEYYNATTPFTNEESNKINNKDFFNKTIIDFVYVPSGNTTIKYAGNFDLLNSDSHTDAENFALASPSYYNENRDNKVYRFSNNLNLSTRVDKNSIFNASIFSDYASAENDLGIVSNTPFLNLNFTSNEYFIRQDKDVQRHNFGYKGSYSIKLGSHVFSAENGMDFRTNKLNTRAGNYSEFYNNISQHNYISYTGVGYQYSLKKKITFGLGLTYYFQNFEFNSDKNQLSYLAPRFNIRTVFNANNILEFNYKFSTDFPDMEYTIPGRIISNYRSLYGTEDVLFNTPLRGHQFGLQYNLFDFKKGFSFITNFSYTIKDKTISSNILTEGNTVITDYKLSPESNMFSSMVFVEKKVGVLSLRGGVSFFKTKNYNFMESVETEFKSNSFSGDFSVGSGFTDFFVNFETGISITSDDFYSGDIKNFSKGYKPYIELSGKISPTLFWYLKAVDEIYKTSTFDMDLFTLSPRLRYNLPKSKWEFSITGANVLNIDKGQRVESYNSGSYFQEKIYSTLRGFVLLGIKYKL